MREAYLERGVNVILFDYPGVGLSGGKFSVQGSYDAVESVYKLLREKYGVEDNRILVEGFSMGSGPASHLGSNHPDINVLLRCPFVRMSEIGVMDLTYHQKKENFRFGDIQTFLERIARFALPYDNEETLKKLRGNLCVFISEDKKMYDDELGTERRLLGAHSVSKKPDSISRAVTISSTNHMSAYRTDSSNDQGGEGLSRELDNFLCSIHFTTALPPDLMPQRNMPNVIIPN